MHKTLNQAKGKEYEKYVVEKLRPFYVDLVLLNQHKRLPFENP